MGERHQLTAETFRASAIDPETAAFNVELEQLLGTVRAVHEMPPAVTREMRERGEGIFGPLELVAEAIERTIPGPDGDLALRVFTPPRVDGVYLHIHGGSWVLGRAHHQDIRNWAIARHCNLAVVSVDYRLAPEDPYPAGPDDCETAALWLIKNSSSEFGSEKLLIGGESAGAHLSAVTLLRLRDRHHYSGFLGANLTYGVFDLSMSPSTAGWGERNLVLSTPIMGWFGDHFVGGRERRDPDISPLYGDLHDMPPALFTVGTLDPLLDDTLFMFSRWVAAANEAELAIYPGGVHGFNAFPIELGRQANVRIDDFLTERLAARAGAALATAAGVA